MKKIIITLISVVCIVLNISGCSQSSVLYRVNIQQGNVIDQAMVKQIHVGMGKDKVADIMGPPVLADMFCNNRWNYVYFFKPGKGKAIVRKYVIIYFVRDRVSRINVQGKLD